MGVPTESVSPQCGPDVRASRVRRTVSQRGDGTYAFKLKIDPTVMDDQELRRPIGALVGQIATAGPGDVWVENEDDGSGAIVNYFGTLDPATGIFRIGQLPAGRYILHVALQGYPQKDIPGIVIAPGQDTILPQPIPVEFGS